MSLSQWDGASPVRWVPYVVVPYLLLVALRLPLAWGLDNPLTPDETVYLGSARYLATGEGLTDSTGRHAYKIGYSVALTPAFLVADDPVGGFKAAQVINAFLLSLIYPAAFWLVGRLWKDLEPVDRMLLGLCVSLYPAAVLYGTTAMSANLFIPTYFLFVGLGLEALGRSSVWGWMGFGAATFMLYGIHERAVGIVVVACAIAGMHAVWGESHRWRAAIFFATGFLTFAFFRWVEVPGSRWHTGSRAEKVITGAIENPGKMLVTTSGHLEYLGFSTFGTLFIGLIFLLLTLRPLASRWTVPKLFWPLLFGSAGSVFAISVLFNVVRWPQPRFTQWIYGRHNEMVLLPVLLIALLALRYAGKAEHRLNFYFSCGLSAGLIAFLSGILRWFWTPVIGPPYSFCATSVSIYMATFHQLGVLLMGFLMVVGYLTMVGLFAWRWRWGMAALTVCFAISTSTTYSEGWRQRYVDKNEQREVVHTVRRIEEVQVPKDRVILHERRGQEKVFHFHYYNDSYFLPDYTFRTFAPKLQPKPGELVLSGRKDFGHDHPRARMVGLENFSKRRTGYVQTLWVLPGPLQRTLGPEGWLVPRGFPKALKPNYLRSEIRVLDPSPLDVPVPLERTRWVPIELTHRGGGPWPHHGGFMDPEYAVGLAMHWFPEGATESVAHSWTPLPRMLYPDETVEMRLRVRPPAELEPGTYRVTAAVGQEIDGRPGPVEREGIELTVQVLKAPGQAERGQ